MVYQAQRASAITNHSLLYWRLTNWVVVDTSDSLGEFPWRSSPQARNIVIAWRYWLCLDALPWGASDT